MNINAHQILIGIALVLTIASVFKPQWPLLSCTMLLICADLLARMSP